HETVASSGHGLHYDRDPLALDLASIVRRHVDHLVRAALAVISFRLLRFPASRVVNFPALSPEPADDLRGSMPGVSDTAVWLVGYRIGPGAVASGLRSVRSTGRAVAHPKASGGCRLSRASHLPAALARVSRHLARASAPRP